MQLGVIFPQTEIGADRKAVRDFVQAAESIATVLVVKGVLYIFSSAPPGVAMASDASAWR